MARFRKKKPARADAAEAALPRSEEAVMRLKEAYGE